MYPDTDSILSVVIGKAQELSLAQYFDTVNHDKLMSLVARKVKDKRVLRLIRLYLKSGVMINGILVETEEGCPQGGPLSPLLSNIMLDELDKELKKRGHRFCRYCDDCNIYVKSKQAGERIMESITHYLEGKLKLKVNKEKSAMDRTPLPLANGSHCQVHGGLSPPSLHPCQAHHIKNPPPESGFAWQLARTLNARVIWHN